MLQDVHNTHKRLKVKTINDNNLPTTYELPDLGCAPSKNVFYREEMTQVEDQEVQLR